MHYSCTAGTDAGNPSHKLKYMESRYPEQIITKGISANLGTRSQLEDTESRHPVPTAAICGIQVSGTDCNKRPEYIESPNIRIRLKMESRHSKQNLGQAGIVHIATVIQIATSSPGRGQKLRHRGPGRKQS